MLKWKTEDGRELLPEDMDDDHLINAIDMVERKIPGKKPYIYKIMVKVACSRGITDRLVPTASEVFPPPSRLRELPDMIVWNEEW